MRGDFTRLIASMDGKGRHEMAIARLAIAAAALLAGVSTGQGPSSSTGGGLTFSST